jgi:uncharacterized membrane protein
MDKKLSENQSSEPIKQKPDLTDRAFKIGLFFKGFDGLIECISGVFLLLVKPEQVSSWAKNLTDGELSRDPNDFVASHILKSAHDLNRASLLFAALYLLSHGIVKLVLVVEVLRNHLWAYAALIVVTALFVIYQVYRMIDSFSVGLLLLTIFDLAIIYLTQKEYKRHKERHDFAKSVF